MLKDEGPRTACATSTCSGWASTASTSWRRTPIFTTYSPEVAKAMLAETAASSTPPPGPRPAGKLEDLFTSSTSFVNGPLAKLYGVTGVTGDGLQKADLNPAQRAGILTHGIFLASHSKEDDSFPIIARRARPAPGAVPGDPRAAASSCRRRPSRSRRDHPQAVRGLHRGGRLRRPATRRSTPSASPSRTTTPSAATGTRRRASRSTPAARWTLPSGTHQLQERHRVHQGARQDARGARLRGPQLDALRCCGGRSARRGRLAQGHQRGVRASDYDMRELLVALTKTRAFTHRNPVGNRGRQAT